MKLNRRDFLFRTSALGLGLALPFPGISLARNPMIKDHFFFMIQVGGGMDVTLGLDPQIHKTGTDQKDVFIEYNESGILKSGNILLGPAAHALKDFHQDMCIINGVVMRRDVGHDSLLNYISSGKGDSSSPSFVVEFSRHCEDTNLGIFVNDSISTGIYQPTISQISDFSLSNKNNSTEGMEFLKEFFLRQSNLKDAQDKMLKFENEKGLFYSALEDVTKLAVFENEKLSTIAAGFKSGQSNAASINLESGSFVENIDLDTHANHEGRHLNSQRQVWEFVSSLFKGFKNISYKDGSLFDHTTFAVVSEFSRTPYLNAAKGKDHNVYTNSVLLAGKGIKGNQAIGGSHVISRAKRQDGLALHIGSPIDFKSGQIIMSPQNTDLIFPENVAKSLHKIIGVDKNIFYPDLFEAAVLPNISKY